VNHEHSVLLLTCGRVRAKQLLHLAVIDDVIVILIFLVQTGAPTEVVRVPPRARGQRECPW